MENERLEQLAGKKNTAEAVFFNPLPDKYYQVLISRRLPVKTLPDKEGVAVPFKIAALIWAAVAPGLRALYKAAAPVTCGVAIEVPL